MQHLTSAKLIGVCAIGVDSRCPSSVHGRRSWDVNSRLRTYKSSLYVRVVDLVVIEPAVFDVVGPHTIFVVLSVALCRCQAIRTADWPFRLCQRETRNDRRSPASQTSAFWAADENLRIQTRCLDVVAISAGGIEYRCSPEVAGRFRGSAETEEEEKGGQGVHKHFQSKRV